MKAIVLIGAVVALALGAFVLTSTDDGATTITENTTNAPNEDMSAEDIPVAASADGLGDTNNDVVREDDYATGSEVAADTSAEGVADATEVATSDIGAASNEATDAAVEEIAEGDAPTSADVVEESRDIAAAAGVVGAVEDYQVDTFDVETVYRGIAESDLDTTVQRELAANLEEAVAEDDAEQLETVLSQIRSELGIQ